MRRLRGDKARSGMLQEMQAEANRQNPRPAKWRNHARLPVLFRAAVARTDASLGGTHMLTGVSVNDVVEVLEEDVGPSDQYCLCRLPGKEKDGRDANLGWYPKEFLLPLK